MRELRKINGCLFAAPFLMCHFLPRFLLAAEPLSSPSTILEVPTRSFIATYGEAKAKEIGYNEFSFSPNGQFLAITISQIATGDPEQVWLFDTVNKKVRLATEKIDQDYHKLGLNIREVTWESPSKICILENRWGSTVPSGANLVKVHATMSSSEIEIFGGPDETRKEAMVLVSPGKHYQFEFDSNGPGDARLVDLSKSPPQDLFVKSQPWYRLAKWTSDDRYVIFYQSHGHGSGSLLAAQTTPSLSTFTIVADGGGDRLGFAISPDSTKIAFPGDGGIAIYDLASRKIRRTIPSALSIGRTLAWSSRGQIAYEADSCQLQSNSKQAQISRDIRKEMRKVCIVDISD